MRFTRNDRGKSKVYRKDFQNIVKEYIKENGLTSSLVMIDS